MSNYKKEPLKKVQALALSYYARKEIQRAIFDFCKNRETIANFNNEFFAKRPDCLDYPSDILNSVKQGATSFHCSEELWENPLDINTNMTPAQYNEIKIGWDFLIDIDSKYFDYSKIAAKVLIGALEHHGIKNIGVKFSGSKGFHILIPFKSFPEEIAGEKTKDHFPEWARFIAGYIKEMTMKKITEGILKVSNREELESKGELVSEKLCPLCGKISEEKIVSKYRCPNFKCRSEMTSMKSNRKQLRCPSCNGDMEKVGEEKINFCEFCNVNTAKMRMSVSKFGGEIRGASKDFSREEKAKSAEDSVDIILVSSRHLFRAPYSLHEKSSLASIVIDKKDIDGFLPQKADPLRVGRPRSFMPEIEEGEAKELLIQALDWAEKKEVKEKKYDGGSIDLKGLEITEEMYPPVIKKILGGIKYDGRKRALSLLLSFFSSLEFPQEFIEEKIGEWNKKNYHHLREGYIRSQILWHVKNKRMPPNYDKPVYKEFGILSPPEQGIKNPINYTIRLAMRAKRVGKMTS